MTRLMVLGLLKMKPMSGYEMQQILQISQTDRWAGILPGSIYHALKKMEKEGLVAVETVEQTGHRIKAIYRITEQGEAEYQALLKTSLMQSSVFLPSGMYTGLGFIHHLSPGEVIDALEIQKKTLESELIAHKNGLEAKRAALGDIDEVTDLTFSNIVSQHELQIDLVDSLLRLYRRKREQ